MKSRVSGRRVKSIIKERLGNHASLLERFGQISKATAGFAIGEPITIAYAVGEILSTCGAVIGILGILEKEIEAEDPSAPIFEYNTEKFDVLYYTICQWSYFRAIDEVFRLNGLDKADQSKYEPLPLDENAIAVLKGLLSKLDSAEVHYFMTVDPVSLNIPLFNVYEEWLGKVLSQAGFTNEKIEEYVNAVKNSSIRIFDMKISDNSDVSNWIRNYLLIKQKRDAWEYISYQLEEQRESLEYITYQLEEQWDSSEHITDQLDEMNSYFKNWMKAQKDRDEELERAWNEYRERLKKLPDERDSMFNENFGVRDVFVCPEVDYYRQGFGGNSEKSRRSLELILGGLLSTRATNDDLIFLCGGPGSGKSTICRLLCDQLARNENIYPILLKLRNLKQVSDVRTFIEKSLIDLGLVNNLKDLRKYENVVLVLDGFDEVVMANKEKLNRLFSKLSDDLQETYALGKTKVVISGRDTLFPGGRGFPGFSHVIELKPFNKLRVRRWVEKWYNTPHKSDCSNRFNPECHIIDSEGKTALHHLVTWPLTLHLVARVHASGYIDLSQKRDIEKAFIYKCIIYDTFMRQEKKRREKDIGRLPTEGLHRFLKDLAWEMHISGQEIIDKRIAKQLLKGFLSEYPEQNLEELSETAILNAPTFKRGEDDTGVEFIHKSFGEYFIAEKIAEEADKLNEKVESQYAEGLQFRIKDNEAVHILTEVCCYRYISEEILDFLTSMIGTYTEYDREEGIAIQYNDMDRTKRIEELLSQLTIRYKKIISAEDLSEVCIYSMS